jgi:glucan phosphoethanolaminetransferase (alkaline phosphatase superfamily)
MCRRVKHSWRSRPTATVAAVAMVTTATPYGPKSFSHQTRFKRVSSLIFSFLSHSHSLSLSLSLSFSLSIYLYLSLFLFITVLFRNILRKPSVLFSYTIRLPVFFIFIFFSAIYRLYRIDWQTTIDDDNNEQGDIQPRVCPWLGFSFARFKNVVVATTSLSHTCTRTHKRYKRKPTWNFADNTLPRVSPSSLTRWSPIRNRKH